MIARFACLALILAEPLSAQEQSSAANSASKSALELRADDAVAAFKGEAEFAEVYSEAMLAEVSAAQLRAAIAQMEAQHGALQSVESVTPTSPTTATLVLRFEKALGTGTISVESGSSAKINGIFMRSFAALDDSLAKIEEDLAALPGEVGVLLTALNGTEEPVIAVNADRQFAIGSTFKLYILSALARSIEDGERQWSDVVPLDRKSFPSGRLQDWPDDAPLTLHTLAALMISISDNTATDILLHHLGRDAVEAELLRIGHSTPAKTLPFLSTLEMFALKGSPANLDKYVAADDAGKRRILTDFEDDVGGKPELVAPPRFVEPYAIDTVEWFASGQDLKLLVKRLSEIADPTARKIMAISTALPAATTDKWDYAGYKGGSEPGVLNLTWLLQDKAGDWHILTLSWNNPDAPVTNSDLDTIAKRILPFAL